jgi:hypothetical protein
VGLRAGVQVGYRIEYHDRPLEGVSFAEPLVDGLPHGLAKQYDAKGQILLVSPFVRGTGIDFWCRSDGSLAEEHPLVRGRQHGTERWWNPDGCTVFAETDYLDGLKHGIAREWTDGQLVRGNPRFFLEGTPVSRARYLQVAVRERHLRPHLREDDRPERAVPELFLRLRRRAGRLARPPRPQTHALASREPVVLGRVVAERRYQVGSDWVLLQVGSPRRASWQSDFYCPFRIVGRESKLYRVFAVDSVQALMLGLQLARFTLLQLRPPALWDGAEVLGDVGIDKTLTSGFGVEFDQGVEARVEEMIAAKGRALKRQRKGRAAGTRQRTAKARRTVRGEWPRARG